MGCKTIAILALAIASVCIHVKTAAAAEPPSTSTLPEPRAIREPSEMKPHVGLQLGMTNPEGSFHSAAEYALDVGFQPYIPFGMSMELSHSETDREGVVDTIKRTTVMAKGTYNFGGEIDFIKYCYVGAGVGASLGEAKALLVSAPLVGFDIPLAGLVREEAGKLSLGALAKYAFYEGSSPDTLSMNGMVKYWF